MHRFDVWAPSKDAVELILDGRRLAMEAGQGGWWSLAVDEAGPGTRYAYAIDGGPPCADPRSAFQPEGPEGPSEVVDHGAFAWNDGGWRGLTLAGSVLYELHIGTFSAAGTFEGAIEHVPHLVELGVDAVELMPVAEFSGRRGWGYDGVNLFAPHHAYGGPDGLKRLVDTCHDVGLGVVFDVVYNHLGPAGNHLPTFGPYFTQRHHTNWGDAVNFDGPGSDEVRAYVVDNALSWLRDYHGDGLRLDAVHAIVDESALPVLEQVTTEVEALAAHLRRPLFLIAESDLNDPRFVRSRDAGGLGFDAAWADEWHHALHTRLTGETSGYYEDFGSTAALAKALRQAWVYDGVWSEHRQRVHGRPPAGLSGSRFVVSTQNHDQVGNRAVGDRSSSLMSEGRCKIAAALLLTSPFVPMLFQGEEWGATTPFQYFTDHQDPDLGRAVSDGRRAEFASFGWDPEEVPDPQHSATFERSTLDWAEPQREGHAELLSWHRELLALRRRTPALTDGRLERTIVHHGDDWLVLERGPVTVAANLGTDDCTLRVLPGRRTLAASHPGVELVEDRLRLAPDSIAILAPARPPNRPSALPSRRTEPVSEPIAHWPGLEVGARTSVVLRRVAP